MRANAVAGPPRLELPADVTMNRLAGCGRGLLVKIRLDTGDEGLFLLDSGTTEVILDHSIVAKLKKHSGTVSAGHFATDIKVSLYTAPQLFLGDTPLILSRKIVVATDLKKLSFLGGDHLLGVLGLNCLANYCLQLDFSANKIRFVDDEKSNTQNWGHPIPLIRRPDGRFNIADNFLGVKGPSSLIDIGCGYDGWLAPKLFQKWKKSAATLTSDGPHRPIGIIAGETYLGLDLQVTPGDDPNDDQHNGIGLGFLARHRVTLDFPKKMLYLKRTSIGPFVDPPTEKMLSLLNDGQLPGLAKDDKVNCEPSLDDPSGLATFCIRKNGDSSLYHYEFVSSPKESWNLQKAWRTNQGGRIIEQYPIP